MSRLLPWLAAAVVLHLGACRSHSAGEDSGAIDSGAIDGGATPDVGDSGGATSDVGDSGGVTSDVWDSGAPVALRNVDVTILYPLPAAGELGALLRPGDPGLGGALLTADVFDQGQVPELDWREPLPDDAARLTALRVVAIRVDPCPGTVVPPPAGAACAPELRLVFQSLKVNGTETSARDGAIHTFHAMSRTDFDAFVRALRDIRGERESDPPVPLDVHPLLGEQGPDGAYARRIRTLVLAHAGVSNLIRVTHFRRVSEPASSFPSVASWQFALREISAGAWQDRMIPTTAVTRQGVVTIVGGVWDAMVTPAVTTPDDPTHVLHASSDQRTQAFSALVRVLNPRVHSSQSIDCVSCHIAPDIALFVGGSLKVEDDPQHFQSSYSLDAIAKNGSEAAGFQNLHMVSYSNRTLSLSSRTVNETAGVLEMLNGS
jgi:hypothetical protein